MEEAPKNLDEEPSSTSQRSDDPPGSDQAPSLGSFHKPEQAPDVSAGSAKTTAGPSFGAEAEPSVASRFHRKEMIDRNRVFVTDNLEPDRLILPLKEMGLIRPNQWNELHDLPTHMKTEKLIDLVYRGTPQMFQGFIQELRNDNQQAVADRLVSGRKSVTESSERRFFLTNQTTIADNLRFEGGLLACLEKHKVISSSKVADVKELPTRHEKAELLLRFVQKGLDDQRLHGLITALEETGQPHLAALITSGDQSQIVPREVKEILTETKFNLTQAAASRGLDELRRFVNSLVQKGNITKPQGEYIYSKRTAEEQAEELLEILQSRPYTEDHKLLIESAQQWKPMLTEPHQRQQIGSRNDVEDVRNLWYSSNVLGTCKQTKTEEQASSSRGKNMPTGSNAIDPSVDGYFDSLRRLVREKVKQKNAELNKNFSVNREGVFYIDLAMESQVSGVLDRKHGEVEDHIRRTAQSFESKTKVKISDIFKPDQGKDEPCRLLMIGAAGMGKTTVSHEQVRLWAEGKTEAKNTVAAYHFECRRLTYLIQERKEHSLADLIFKRHGPGSLSEPEKESVLRYITAKPSSVQFTIDGLDELAMWSTCSETTPEICDVREKAQIHQIIYNLIHKHLLPDSKVLVTSRPISSVSKEDFDKLLVALGFSDSSIKECLRALCPSEGIYQKVIDHIVQHNLIIYCVVPLTCMLLGVSLRDAFSGASTLNVSFEIDSMTRLFGKSTLEHVWRRPDPEVCGQTVYDLSPNQRSTLLTLAALAARGMFSPETVIVFHNSDLEAVQMSPDQDNFGLLEVTEQPRRGSRYRHPCTCHFLHLTYQEFLAGLHVCVTWEEEDVASLTAPGQRLDMVRLYVAGLLGDPEGRRLLRAVVAETSEGTLQDRAKALIHALSQNKVEPHVILASGEKKQKQDEDNLRALSSISCVKEGRMGDLIPDIEGRLCMEADGLLTLEMCEVPGGLPPHLLSALGYLLQHSTNVNALSLFSNTITARGAESLARSCPGLTRLRRLNLFGMSLGDEGAAALAPLILGNAGLEVLNMGFNNITARGAKSLARACPGLTRLRSLNLDHNSLGDQGTAALVPLIQNHRGLEVLMLGSNNIGDVGAQSLAGCLPELAGLRALDLFSNRITDVGAGQMAALLRNNRGITRLWLRDNEFLTQDTKARLRQEFGDRVWV